ncbi:MAG: helix-hairpin-helix domain-containing protein [Candidatus Kapaibacterium sp.]
MNEKEILKKFKTIPGVGKSIAADLWEMGYRNIDELRNENPDEMYRRLCDLRGMHLDRCMQYVFRCAVYYVSNTDHDPELLKWWNWKNRPL